jgi:two-component system sensor histidine kinase KdpD
LIDELPHTNVPGSAQPKRWQDVDRVLGAGIDVLTTMNVQHLESLNDQIWRSAGVRVRETIPDWVVKQADEMVMVDLTPRALLNRFERGVVYPPDRARAALENFFKEPTLVALRELAMRQTAHAVESRYAHHESPPPGSRMPAPREPHDRLLLVIGPDAASAALIRRGRRVADYLRAECLAVCVSDAPDLADLGQERRDSLQRQLSFARGLHIDTQILERRGTAAETIVSFARLHGVTQIFVTRQSGTGIRSWLTKPLVQQIVDLARDMQVTIVSDRSQRRGID